MANILPIQKLNDFLHYDAGTGRFTWRWRPRDCFTSDRSFKTWNAKFAGKPALNTPHSAGYLVGRVEWTLFKAHRVAWAMSHGAWPEHEIDHLNRDKTDNRLANLRSVTTLGNGRNRPVQANSPHGISGVGMRRGKWYARIKVDQRLHHLGTFATKDEAIEARRVAERRHGFLQDITSAPRPREMQGSRE